MANQKDESVQRWTAKRRSALVMSIIKGETSAQEAARKHGLTVAEIEDWKRSHETPHGARGPLPARSERVRDRTARSS